MFNRTLLYRPVFCATSIPNRINVGINVILCNDKRNLQNASEKIKGLI